MVLKVALSAGHGYHTPGKRTPDGEREWSFNDKVTRALHERLLQYDGVQVLRLDDPTGKVDVSLTVRSNKANEWGADIYIATHHNAYQGRWGTHTGTESFTYNGDWGGKKANNPKELELAKALNDAIVTAYGLRNRGLKKENFHEVREPKMLAVLTEGGYMDSSIDIKIMRDDKKLRQSGINQADAIAKIYGLKLKGSQEAKKPTSTSISKTVDQLAQEVIKGLHGTGDARKKRLGAQYAAVQARVNQILAPNAKPAPKPKPQKTVEQLAREVIDGKHGNGDARKKSLGSQYAAVQKRVDEMLAPKPKLKPNDTIAREVIQGLWGNGADRKPRLERAGYNYNTIQSLVNRMF